MQKDCLFGKYPYICTAIEKDFMFFLIRRDGRVVDYSGLENRRTERYRGFESLSLRKQGCKSASYAIYTLFYAPKATPLTPSPSFPPQRYSKGEEALRFHALAILSM